MKSNGKIEEPLPVSASGIRTNVPQPGWVLHNRYKLIARLGKGGNGRVFEAIHLPSGQKRAVRILPKTEVEEGKFLEQAGVAVELKHRNIVEVSDAGVSAEGYRFVAMELLTGETLKEWIGSVSNKDRDEPYIRKVVGFMRGMCRGVDAAREKSSTYPDLKPADIFLICDESQKPPELTPKIMGLPVPCSDSSQRSDVYSLGAILYEALTGTTLKAVRPGKLNNRIPRALDRICLKALQKRPGKRFRSVMELSRALAEAPLDSGEPDEFGEGFVSKLVARMSSKAFVMTACASVLGILAVFDFFSRSGNRESTPQKSSRVSIPISFAQSDPGKSDEVGAKTADLVRLGAQALEAEKPEEAERLFKQAIDLEPGNSSAWSGFGEAAFDQGKYDAAVSRLRTALSIEDRPSRRLLLGRALLKDDKRDEAVEEWKRIVNSAPIDDPVSRAAGQLLEANGVRTN